MLTPAQQIELEEAQRDAACENLARAVIEIRSGIAELDADDAFALRPMRKALRAVLAAIAEIEELTEVDDEEETGDEQEEARRDYERGLEGPWMRPEPTRHARTAPVAAPIAGRGL